MHGVLPGTLVGIQKVSTHTGYLGLMPVPSKFWPVYMKLFSIFPCSLSCPFVLRYSSWNSPLSLLSLLLSLLHFLPYSRISSVPMPNALHLVWLLSPPSVVVTKHLRMVCECSMDNSPCFSFTVGKVVREVSLPASVTRVTLDPCNAVSLS